MIGVDTTALVHLEIQELPQHSTARAWLQREVLDRGSVLALAPQVLVEFMHIVTDSRRFERPLTMEQALDKARYWWNAREVRHVYPTAESSLLLLTWLSQHQLGRKRLLDTQLAATLWTAGVRRVLTSNVRDFSVFGVFDVVTP